jgi:hypothetical protein
VQRYAGDTRAVVVFNEQHVAMVSQQLTQVGRTCSGDGGAGRVLGARGHHDGPHATAQCPGHIGGQRPVVVDPHRLSRKAQRGKQI